MEKIRFGQNERSAVIKKPGVVIGQLRKESEMLNANGDVINPRTKQVIRPRDNENILRE
jgi:hypothetical protein